MILWLKTPQSKIIARIIAESIVAKKPELDMFLHMYK